MINDDEGKLVKGLGRTLVQSVSVLILVLRLEENTPLGRALNMYIYSLNVFPFLRSHRSNFRSCHVAAGRTIRRISLASRELEHLHAYARDRLEAAVATRGKGAKPPEINMRQIFGCKHTPFYPLKMKVKVREYQIGQHGKVEDCHA